MQSETRSDHTSRHHTVVETDVVVVGARCAGAATAMLLARSGHDVVIVDRATFPSDTLSTHALARGGVVQLHRWGLLDRLMSTGAPAVRRVEFHAGAEPVVRQIKDRYGVDFVVAPRRHVLDPLLQSAAVEAGVRLRTGVTVDDVLIERGRAVGVAGRDGEREIEIRARHVVGADGLRSRVARAVGSPIVEARGSRSATFYRYHPGDWQAMEYHVSDVGFAGVFPTHAGEACIWVCAPDEFALDHRRRAADPGAAFDEMIRVIAPGLADRIAATRPTSTVRGMLGIPNQLRAASGSGWSLVGDAGYHRDAITGHGITDAFRDAELLADALGRVLDGTDDEPTALERYGAERDAMLRDVFEITCELSEFPGRERFIELQKDLAVAIDRQSEILAARPLPGVIAAA